MAVNEAEGADGRAVFTRSVLTEKAPMFRDGRWVIRKWKFGADEHEEAQGEVDFVLFRRDADGRQFEFDLFYRIDRNNVVEDLTRANSSESCTYRDEQGRTEFDFRPATGSEERTFLRMIFGECFRGWTKNEKYR